MALFINLLENAKENTIEFMTFSLPIAEPFPISISTTFDNFRILP